MMRGSRSGPDRDATLLVLGNYLPSLSVVRSLGSAGYRVVAGDGGEFSTVAHSRHCQEVWAHPPVDDPDAFMAALVGFLEARRAITTVLPLQERYVASLATMRDRLPPDVTVASPDPATVLTCLDKGRLHELARDAGVPSRPGATASDVAGLRQAAVETGYPCVIRPADRAGVPLPGNRKALIAYDASQLEQAFSTWPARATLLVQPFVEGPRHNVYFAARSGAILAAVETRILRTDRLDGTGYAVEGVTVAPDAGLRRSCDLLVSRLAYTGIGCAQFLVPARGEPHFLELNPRHGAAAEIARHCGVDLTLAAVALARGETWPPEGTPLRYPAGRRYAWTTGDLNALRIALKGREVGGRRSLVWLARAIVAALRADVHLTWSWRDPMPTVALIARWIPLERLRRWSRPVHG